MPTKKPQPLFATSSRKEQATGIVESKDETNLTPAKNHYVKFSESIASPPRKIDNEIVVGDIGSEEADFIRQQRHLFKNFKSATGNIAPSSPVITNSNNAASMVSPGRESKLSNPFPTLDFSSLETLEHLLIIEDYSFAHPITTVHIGDTITFALAGSTKAHVEHSLKGVSDVKELCFETGLLQINHCRQFSFQPTVTGEIQVACEVDPDTFCMIEVKENTAPRIRKVVADNTGLTAVAVTFTESLDNVEKVDDDSFYDTDDNISDLDEEQDHLEPSSYDKVPADKDFIVCINESGFRPAVIQCECGDSVKFIAQSKHWFCNIACDGMFQNVLLDGDDDHPVYQIQFNHAGVFEVYNQDFYWINCRVEVAGNGHHGERVDFVMNPFNTIPPSVSNQSLPDYELLMDLKCSSDNRYIDEDVFSGSLAQSLSISTSKQQVTKAPPSYTFTSSNASPILKQTEALRLFGSFLPTSAAILKSQSSPTKSTISQPAAVTRSNPANADDSDEDGDDDDEDSDNENSNRRSKSSKANQARKAKKRRSYKKKHRQRLRKVEKERSNNNTTQVDSLEDSYNNPPKPVMLTRHSLATADWSEEFDDLPADNSLASDDRKPVQSNSTLSQEQTKAVTYEFESPAEQSPQLGQKPLHHLLYDHSEDGSMMSSFDPADDCGPFMEFADTDDDTEEDDNDDDASFTVLTPVKEKLQLPQHENQAQSNKSFNEEKNSITELLPSTPNSNQAESSSSSNNADRTTQVCTPDSGISNKRNILFSALGLKTPNTAVEMSYLSWTREPNDVDEDELEANCDDHINLLAYEDGQSDWSAEEEIVIDDDNVNNNVDEIEEESVEHLSAAPTELLETIAEEAVFEAALQDFFLDRK